MNEDGFIKEENTRGKFKRPYAERRPKYVAPKTENKRKSKYVTIANGQQKRKKI